MSIGKYCTTNNTVLVRHHPSTGSLSLSTLVDDVFISHSGVAALNPATTTHSGILDSVLTGLSLS